MKNKIFKTLSITIIVLFLTTPFVSGIQTQQIVKKDNEDFESDWGYCILFVMVHERYGEPDNPQYRRLEGATVFYWWHFQWFVKLIYNSNKITEYYKSLLLRILAYEIDKTDDDGWSSVGRQLWWPTLMVYVKKEGYHTTDALFKYGNPDEGGPQEWNFLKFYMEKD